MRRVDRLKEGLKEGEPPGDADTAALPDAPDEGNGQGAAAHDNTESQGPPHIEAAEQVNLEILQAPGHAAVIRMTATREDGGTVQVQAGMQRVQLRELAARMLMVADADSGGTERTVLAVTPISSWIPGQCLQVRFTPGPHFQFTMKVPGEALSSVPPRQLILPAGYRRN